MARLVPCLSQSENPCRSPTSSKLLDTHTKEYFFSSRHGELNGIEEALLCILDGQTWLSVESCFQYNRGRCPGRYGNTVEIDESISFLKKWFRVLFCCWNFMTTDPENCVYTASWLLIESLWGVYFLISYMCGDIGHVHLVNNNKNVSYTVYYYLIILMAVVVESMFYQYMVRPLVCDCPTRWWR